MTSPISRRTLVRGAAWSAPVIAASAAVPAYAASYCTDANKLAIDNAFTEVATKALTAYWTEPSAGLADGFAKVPSFNIINNSQFDINLSNTNGLQIRFQAVNADGSTGLPNGPTSTATSWGTTSSVTTTTVGTQQARTWTWTANGTNLVANKAGNDNIADTNFNTGSNTVHNGLNVLATLVQAPVIYPSLASIQAVAGTDLSACTAYYNSKVATAQPVTISFAGPKFTSGSALWNNDGAVNTLSGGAQAWTVGTGIWSGTAGNYLSSVNPPGGGTGSTYNGIF